jgi:hypothetical protein
MSNNNSSKEDNIKNSSSMSPNKSKSDNTSFNVHKSFNEENNYINQSRFFDAIIDCNHLEIKSFFKNENFRCWEWTENDGYTCLHRACFMDLFLIVQLMIDEIKQRCKPEDLKSWLDTPSTQGFRAIHFASYRGNIQMVKLLIQNGCNYSINLINEKGLNVLHMAAQGDQPTSLVYFKEKYNFDLEYKDSVGSTPFHWACFTGSELAINFLLSYNVNIQVQDSQGLTPLHLSVMSGKKYI